MNLSRLSITALALIVVVGIAQQWAAPDTITWWRYLAAFLVAGLLYEWLNSRSTKLYVVAAPQCQLRLGRREQVTISIANGDRRARTLLFAPGTPSEIEGDTAERVVDLGASGSQAVELSLTGREMGRFSWLRVPAKVKGALGLGWWPVNLAINTELVVNPDLLCTGDRAEGDLVIGDRSTRTGAGFELDHLREYARGDPLRTIDWKATARGQKLITRVFSDEQHLEIFLVVDTGSTSRVHVDGMSQLGHYINLAAQFAQFAMANGDKVGLVAVADKPLLSLPPQRGIHGVQTINRALRELRFSPVETDILSAALQVQRLARKRCLVILITDLYGQVLEGNFGRSLKLWQTRHLPFVVSLIGKDVIAIREGAAGDAIDPFTSLAAADYYATVMANAEAARRLGAKAIIARPAELQARVIREYQLLKRQRRV